MKALVFCAGLGTRLRPLTYTTPKVMIEVAGKPCLEHIVEHLNSHGIEDIVVNLHYLPEKIYKYFGDRLLYFYEPVLLGEKETERRLLPWLGTEYVVCNGDTLTDINISALAITNKGGRLLGWDGVYTGLTHVKKDLSKYTHLDHYLGKHYWQDIGTPDGLAKAREYYARRTQG